MHETLARATTGLDRLDTIIDQLRIGDNVVWAVDEIDDYREFVKPFVEAALKEKRQVVYFRFARHKELLTEMEGVVRHELDAHTGFESFTTSVYRLATQHGEETFYVFDCLSDLLHAWATDEMIGNFFGVTCPYLFKLKTIAYFGVLRTFHSFQTIKRIRETTQVMLGIYHHGDHRHLHPFKVCKRDSPTMFLPHKMLGRMFVPVANSEEATSLLSDMQKVSLDSSRRRLDAWDRLFLEAEDVAKVGPSHPDYQPKLETLTRVMVTKDVRIGELAKKYFSLKDLLNIKSRMIGTGYIGGKAVGMLLARKILESDKNEQWSERLEPHDSFYIGSDIFYAYMVHNKWWDLFMQQKTQDGYFQAAKTLEQEMLNGDFPVSWRDHLQQMLEYFGQYPLVVRSSSLLEDGFSGAFAGKYDSYFCVNQGSPEFRLEQLMYAIRMIFASTMSVDALTYRRQRGLAQREEPMALLVQRVSGRYRKHFYMPDLAGVGVSYNTFVWSHDMDPRAGMVRLVMGLGTRAVDRVEGDYPCTIALDQPQRRPYDGQTGARRFSQRDVDLLNVDMNAFMSMSLSELIADDALPDIFRYAVRDRIHQQRLRETGSKDDASWLLTFQPLLLQTDFAATFSKLLKTLEDAYASPVDIEFTININSQDFMRINIVQCRPLQTRGAEDRVELPQNIPKEQLLFRTNGNFMGGSMKMPLHRIIWVDPAAYHATSISERHQIARLIGLLNQQLAGMGNQPTLLCGPGRWGTSTPSLGVPVRFSEINHMAALMEIASVEAGIMPELSYGTHFFQDLVERNTFYVALALDRSDCTLNQAYLNRLENKFSAMLPSEKQYENIIRVYDLAAGQLTLFSDVVHQQAICCNADA